MKCLLDQGEDLKVEENHFTVPVSFLGVGLVGNVNIVS